jgi:hypothetical protein
MPTSSGECLGAGRDGRDKIAELEFRLPDKDPR